MLPLLVDLQGYKANYDKRTAYIDKYANMTDSDMVLQVYSIHAIRPPP
jgi:hypothetical protein